MADIEKKPPSGSEFPSPELKGDPTFDDDKLKNVSDEDIDDTRERVLRQYNEELNARDALQQQKIPVLPFTQFFGRKNKNFDINAVATQPSVYDNEAAAAYCRPHERYENRHRFDPKCRWTWAEELPLINKMDARSKSLTCKSMFDTWLTLL